MINFLESTEILQKKFCPRKNIKNHNCYKQRMQSESFQCFYQVALWKLRALVSSPTNCITAPETSESLFINKKLTWLKNRILRTGKCLWLVCSCFVNQAHQVWVLKPHSFLRVCLWYFISFLCKMFSLWVSFQLPLFLWSPRGAECLEKDFWISFNYKLPGSYIWQSWEENKNAFIARAKVISGSKIIIKQMYFRTVLHDHSFYPDVWD